MDKTIRASALLTLGLAMAATLAWGQPPAPAAAPFVPGQVLVQLTEGGAGGQALGQADPDHLDTDPALTEYLATVSREVAMPLRVLRRTSGGELVLAIDLEALASELRERLSRDPRVESVQEREVAPDTGLIDVGVEMLVRFHAGTEAARTVGEPHAEGLKTSSGCRELALDLVGNLAHEPKTLVAGPSELRLGIDLRGLTRDLVNRLRRLPDVQYAQLNLVLQTFR